MKTVAIESPYAGDIEANKAYLQGCISWCIARNKTPYASHQMLTDALDDNRPFERNLGIKAGLEMSCAMDEVIFFIDLGWSEGMLAARQFYEKEGIVYSVRRIGWGL